MHEPEEFVKPATVRMKSWMTAQMPLSDQTRCVTGVMQVLSQCDFTPWQASLWVFVVMPNRIEFVSKSCLVATGYDPGARRTAVRSRDVPTRESDAILRD